MKKRRLCSTSCMAGAFIFHDRARIGAIFMAFSYSLSVNKLAKKTLIYDKSIKQKKKQVTINDRPAFLLPS